MKLQTQIIGMCTIKTLITVYICVLVAWLVNAVLPMGKEE